MVEELLIHGHEKHVILRDLLSRKVNIFIFYYLYMYYKYFKYY